MPRANTAKKTYACMPSTASKVWYKNIPTAQLAYTQGGQSVSRLGLYHMMVMKFKTTNANPVRVICRSLAPGSQRGTALDTPQGIE